MTITIHSRGKDLPKIKEDLICTMKNMLKWFKLNSLKANPGKFHFMILDDKTCHKHILKIDLTCARCSDAGCTNYSSFVKNLKFILKCF